MITNAVSIQFLEVPNVLTPLDISNRSNNSGNNSKRASNLSIFSGTTSIREVEKDVENTKIKNQRKYFSRISSCLVPKPCLTPKYKVMEGLPISKLQFQRRTSDPCFKIRIKNSQVNRKYTQKPKPISFNFQINRQSKLNTRFTSIIQEALKRQAENKNNLRQIQTDSEESSSNLISSKKLINSFQYNDFQKGKFLGKGQFGQVHLVRHKQTGFVCAMKTIQKSYIKQQKLQIQLAREIKIHSFLNHPNINQMYGFSWDNNHIYLLLELCSDGEVFKILKKRRRTTEKQAAFIIKQMVDAVSAMHSLNVIHRDLKPENLIMHEGIIKVIDFGWATDYRGKHRNTLCGTPLYYSPEMVKKESYDFNVDIWSIGILAYQLLIGNIPFSIWTQMQLHKIADQQIKFPSYVQISSSAKQFILNILKKDPKKRMKLEDILRHQFLSKVDLMQSLDLFADE